MKKVLICSYYYPPFIHSYSFIASLRLSKFVKYLPTFGFEPFILASKDFRGTQIINDNDATLNNIYHTSFIDPYYNIINIFNKNTNDASSVQSMDNTSIKLLNKKISSIVIKRYIHDMIVWPDTQISWVLFGDAIKIGSKIIESENIDVIMSSSPPGTSHIIANILSKKYCLPWLADYRDSWTANGEYVRVEPFRRIDAWLEKKCLNEASALSAVSKPMAEELSQFHSKPTYTITNGFDEDDYNFNIKLDQKFTISYTGHITSIQLLSFIILFKAVSELINNGQIDGSNLRIQIWGQNSREHILNLANRYGVQNSIQICGQVSYCDSIKYQKCAQILLSLEALENRKGVYTGKIFEYLGARRPILAIAQRGGAIDDLINMTQSGILCCDVQNVKEILLKWYSEWKQNGLVAYLGRDDEIRKFTRFEITRQLSNILHDLIKKEYN